MMGLLFLIALLFFLCLMLWKMWRSSRKYPPQKGFATNLPAMENLADPLVRAITESCAADGRSYRILSNVVIPKMRGLERFRILLFHETGAYLFESNERICSRSKNVTAILQNFLGKDSENLPVYDFVVPAKTSAISSKEILNLGEELKQLLEMGPSVSSPEQINAWCEKIR